MTFTYDVSTPTDVTRVRFYLRDTTETNAAFTDEEIEFAIDETGTWQKATLACIDNLVAELASTPDWSSDNHRIAYGRSVESWLALRRTLSAKFGTSTVTATTSHTYRADSLADEAPDYDE